MSNAWIPDCTAEIGGFPDHDFMATAMLFLADLDTTEMMLMDDDTCQQPIESTDLSDISPDAFDQPLMVPLMPIQPELKWQATTTPRSEDDTANALKIKFTHEMDKTPRDASTTMLTPMPTQTPTTMTRRLRTGDRRRQEIRRLRVEAHDLERQLHELQERLVVNRHTPIWRSEEEAQIILDAWRSIANHQLEQRRQTEETRTRLLSLVEQHRQIAANLQWMIRNQVNGQLGTSPKSTDELQRLNAF